MSAKRPHPLPFLSGFIGLMVAVQILYKLAGDYSLHHGGVLAGWLLNPYLIGALGMLAIAMVLWLLTLKLMPLSRAYPWTAAIYVLTPLCSTVFFHDPLSLRYAIGMGLIIVGIAVTARKQEAQA